MPKILIVFDTPQWSNQEVAEQIKDKSLNYEITTVWANNAFPALLDRYDMVHFLFWMDWLAYKEKFGIPKIPSIVQIHHWIAEDNQWDEFRRIMSGATILTTSSLHWQGVLLAEGIMAEYTPLGVDCDYFKPSQHKRKHDKPLVGWLGRPSPRKGIDILKAVVPSAGHQLITNNSHANRLTKKELLAWYHELDLYVSAASLEGGPMPVLEAMACGVPVVISTTGMWRELSKSEGCVEIHGDMGQWVLYYPILANMILDKPTAGPDVRRTALEFDWHNIIKHYEAAYKACLSWRN